MGPELGPRGTGCHRVCGIHDLVGSARRRKRRIRRGPILCVKPCSDGASRRDPVDTVRRTAWRRRPCREAAEIPVADAEASARVSRRYWHSSRPNSAVRAQANRRLPVIKARLSRPHLDVPTDQAWYALSTGWRFNQVPTGMRFGRRAFGGCLSSPLAGRPEARPATGGRCSGGAVCGGRP